MIELVRAQVPDLYVDEIDVTANPAVAVRYGVMSTPAIAIDGKLSFAGVPREEALLVRLRAAGIRRQAG